MIKKNILIYIAILFFTIPIKAQNTILKNPKKAALYSAALPGLGQIYTKKYWKVPIIYAGLIASGYYIKENHNLYTIYKNTYIGRIENNEPDEYTNIYSDDQLVTLTEYYKRNTEISVLLFVLTYTLNIIDASVNAHLFEYNISEELSIKIRPTYLEKENIGGLSLLIKL